MAPSRRNKFVDRRLSNSMSQSRLRRFLFESLENRLLLAGDLDWSRSISLAALDDSKVEQQIKSTHAYYVDGQPQSMVVLSDRLALDLSPTAEADRTKLNPFGLQVRRELNEHFSVYTVQQPITSQFVEALKSSGLFDQVVPVFGVVESRSEAVLLNEAIVALPEGSDPTVFFADSRFESFRRLDGTPDQFVAKLRNGFGPDALAVINQLDGEPTTNWVAPNFYQDWQRFFIPNDPRFSNLWHLHHTGQGGGVADTDPNLPEAWDIIPGQTANIVVGVVDDGVSIDHPDLLNWVNAGEIPGDGIDNDNNGWIDDVNGWNFVTNNNVSFPDTVNDAHGTSVAGVAAARGDNNIGVVGPAYRSPVISARIFRNGSPTNDANIASAIYYTSGRTANGLGTFPAAHIVNHSWGGGGISAAINAAVTWSSTLGRGGLGSPQLFATGNGFGAVSYPATLSATQAGVMAIGAINNFGEKSNYSNFGSQVDVVTPSNDTRTGYLAIDTTDRIGAAGYSPDDYTGTGSTGFGGTSSATPLATGIGALTLARAQQLGVNITAAELKRLFRNNTKLAGADPYPLPVGRNDLLGYGLLNAQTLVSGVGAPKVSITTERRVINDLDVVNIGQTVIDGTYDVRLRIRNQGTLPLSINQVKVTGADFSIFQGAQANTLQLGDSTTFTVRLMPTSAGAKLGIVTVLTNDTTLPTMRFTISSNTIASNVSGYFYEDFNGDASRTVDELGLPGQTVFIDGNNNGIIDYTSFINTTPVAISDNTTVSSTLAVSGVVGAVRDLNVTVNITHTWVGDLTLELISPSGTRVRLMQNRGGSGDNLVNTRFDDQATMPIAGGAAPFTGSFRPEAPLAAFNGAAANGNWRLEVNDNAGGDTGTLTSWRIEVTTEQVTTTDSHGFYFFTNVSNGSINVIGVTPGGYIPSGPTQYPITITGPNDSFRDRDFGVYRSSMVYAHAFLDYDRNGIRAVDEPGLPNQTFTVIGPQIAVYTNSTATPIVDLGTVDVPIVVPAGAGPVLEVEVTINLVHTWNSDLNISLIAPSGQIVDLSSGNGGSGDNYTNTIFDDDATQSITTGVSPFTGRFRPEQPLSLVNGSPASGTWRLRIADVVGGDSGTLLNWSLRLTANQQGTVTTGPTGWAAVNVLPGVQRFDLGLQPNWLFTSPATGSRTLTSTGAPVFDQSFGTRPINLPPTIDDIVDLTINEDAGPQVINLSGITAGRGDPESVRVSVSSNSTSSITTPVINYSFPSTTGTIQFDTVPDQSGQTVITVTVEDAGPDGTFATADDLTTTTSFVVTVLPVNDQPLLDPLSDMILNEDAPLQTVAFSGVAAGGGESQALRVTAVSSNPAVIPDPTVTYVSPSATGILRFTPLPNMSGLSVITVTTTDAGLDNVFGTGDELSMVRTFSVTVLPVNDQPTLDPLPNITIDEDAPMVTVGLSGITAGPLESQALRVLVNSSNPGLIPTPTVLYTSANPVGQLQFTPLPNQFGTAVITVIVEDAGLDNDLSTTADNGSISRSFTVTVLPVQDPPYFDPIADVVINEDSINNLINITGIDTGGGEIQPMRIIARSSKPGELANLTTTYTSPNPVATIQIDTLPNQFGSFFVTVILEDGGADGDLDTPADNLYFRRTFSVTVAPVNDPPTINPVANVVILEDSPLQTISLSGMSAGIGEDEPFVVSFTNDNPGLIGTPVLSHTWPNSSGQFRFTPIANKFGTAVIVLNLMDAGLDYRLSTIADNAVLLHTFTISVLAVNDPPTLDPIANISMAEDASGQFIDLTGISAGVDEVQPLRVTATSNNASLIPQPIVAYSSPNSTGSLFISPQANQSGTAVIVVTVEDGGVDANLSTTGDNTSFSRTLTVTVTPVNDPPQLDLLADVTVNEDAAMQTTMLSGISAGPNETQPLRVTAISSNNALIPNPIVTYSSPGSTGMLSWTPVANQFGTAVITVSVEDGGLDQSLATPVDNLTIQRSFTITVVGTNDMPTLDTPSNLIIQEDAAPRIINLTGITAGPNESQVLRVTAGSSDLSLIPQPTVSYTSPANAGSLTIAPAPDRFGSAIITVTVEDGGMDNDLSTAADNGLTQKLFTVTVLPVNDAPTIIAIPNVQTLEDTEVTVNLQGIGPGNFESQQLRITAISGNPALFATPLVFYTSPDSIGAIRLTPAQGQSGQAIITVTVEDAGDDNDFSTLVDNASTVTSFTVTVLAVNDPPTMNTVGNVTMDEDASASLSITGISAGDGEVQPLSVMVLSNDESLVQARAIYTSPQDWATIELVAQPDRFGSTSIVVTIMDGGLDNDLSTLNDNGLITSTFSVVVRPVNDAPEIDSISDVSIDEDSQLEVILTGINAGPNESQVLRVAVESSDLSLIPQPTMSYTSPATTGRLTLIPAPDRFGVAIITVTVEDGGTDNDLSTTADNGVTEKLFTVTVLPVNDVPTIAAIPHIETPEDTEVTVDLQGISPGGSESQQLRVTAISSNQALVATPLVFYTSPDSIGTIRLTPSQGQSGQAIIIVTVEDAGDDNDFSTLVDNASTSTSFTVTVLAVNDPPTLDHVGDVTMDEDATLSLTITGISAGDGEIQPLSVTVLSNDQALMQARAIYTSPQDWATIELVAQPDRFGSTSIVVTIMDGGLDNNLSTLNDNGVIVSTFSVVVRPVNDAPEIDPINDVSIDEDGQLELTLSGITAGPGETQAIRVTANSSNPSIVPHPTVAYMSPADSAELNIEPVADAFGAAVIIVTVEDGGADNDLDTLSDNAAFSRTFTVTVLPQNDPPVIDTPSDLVVDWNSLEQSITLTGISSGPGEADPLRVLASTNNPGIVQSIQVDYVSGNADATLRFTPVADKFGRVQMNLVVEDGGADGDLSTTNDNRQTMVSFEILVNAVPEAEPERVRTVLQVPVAVDVLANDTDADGTVAELSVVIIQAPPAAQGTVSILLNGQVRFVPAAGFSGVSRFTYAARDQYGAQSAGTEVLVGIGRSRLQNPFDNLDVNGNNNVTSADALLIINLLNDSGRGRLVDELPMDFDDVDVNGDGRITAADALTIINFLNSRAGGGGEGEQSLSAVPLPIANDYFFAGYLEPGEDSRLKGRRARM